MYVARKNIKPVATHGHSPSNINMKDLSVVNLNLFPKNERNNIVFFILEKISNQQKV
jgi:hypothetical protein